MNDWIQACNSDQAMQGIDIESVELLYQAMLVADDSNAAESLRCWWQIANGAAEAGRSFNKEMKVSTVLGLSDEWHERAAGNKAENVAFLEPWRDGAEIGDYRIEPVRTSVELGRYAHKLKNCAAGYAKRIANGQCFFYVVFHKDSLVAMFKLGRRDESIVLRELKGPRNEVIPSQSPMRTAITKWLSGSNVTSINSAVSRHGIQPDQYEEVTGEPPMIREYLQEAL